MCGIAGIFNFRTRKPAEESLLTSMRDTMVHRGPDDGGLFAEAELGLVHRRLSILDLSPRGHQPMSSHDGRYVTVFNGEIYNYLELKAAHFPGDRDFASHSDTEVLLAMYGKLGAGCLGHFNGMFAFAVWDKKDKTLFLARDRLGKKPLYYTLTADGIAFASELKALLEIPGIDRSISEDHLQAYMAFGYIPGEDTLMKHIRKLAPGHFLRVDAGGKVETGSYWSLQFRPERDRGMAAYLPEFNNLLEDAIKLRLRSDVPLGIFLSGGLDSSTVVSMLSGNGARLKTFSVAFDLGKEYDETAYARIVARHFGTEHHEIMLSQQEFQDSIPHYIRHMEEPITQASAIPLYHIAKLARKHVTVVLSGEGADEMLGGYDIYNYMRVIDRYRKIPRFVRKGLSRLLFKPLGIRKLDKYDALADLPLERGYFGVDFRGREWMDRAFSEPFRARMDPAWLDAFASRFHDPAIRDVLNKMLYFDTKTWLVDNLLTKADKMSMAPSLELRCPFLDFRLVEFCAALPVKYKIHGFSKKFILKKTMAGRLPPEILARKKVGFPTPLKTMFQGTMAGYASDVLESAAFRQRGIFDGKLVSTMLADHRNGKADYHRELWQMLVLEEWYRTFAA
ncbi:MAG: asparagine synthase [Fibrobacteres bacterium]|nr:asparagine synthase [Fibrobacterota bacterium]